MNLAQDGEELLVNGIVSEHTGISPEMAVRLSIAFGTSSELWLNMQSSYDLWHAEQRRKELRVESIIAA